MRGWTNDQFSPKTIRKEENERPENNIQTEDLTENELLVKIESENQTFNLHLVFFSVISLKSCNTCMTSSVREVTLKMELLTNTRYTI